MRNIEIPAPFSQYAENAWRRFPEVLLALGSPDLEDYFEVHEAGSGHQRVMETEAAKVIEIRLPRRGRYGKRVQCAALADEQCDHYKQTSVHDGLRMAIDGSMQRAANSSCAGSGFAKTDDDVIMAQNHVSAKERTRWSCRVVWREKARGTSEHHEEVDSSPGGLSTGEMDYQARHTSEADNQERQSFSVDTPPSEMLNTPWKHRARPFQSMIAPPQQRIHNHEPQQQQPQRPPTVAKPLVSKLAIRRGVAVRSVQTQGLGRETPNAVTRRPELDRVGGHCVHQHIAPPALPEPTIAQMEGSATCDNRPRFQHHVPQQQQSQRPPSAAQPLVSKLAIRRGRAIQNVQTQGLGEKKLSSVTRLPELDRVAGHRFHQHRAPSAMPAPTTAQIESSAVWDKRPRL